MMTGIIPCLYNSFSFTPANLADYGNILCYDIRGEVKPQSIHIKTGSNECSQVLPEPMFIIKVPEAEVDTESVSSESSESSVSEQSSGESVSLTPISESNITADAVPFHPSDMSKYAYSSANTTDSLLWSLYIMLYGVEKFEMVDNEYTESNRFKFELIELLRQNKPVLKANKLKISALEESLVHKQFITLETVHAVVACKSMSIMIVQDRKYYDVVGGGEGATFIIEKIKGKYVLYNSPHVIVAKYITYIRENYWRMESISAPIRPLSAYKLQDLVDISTKLGLAVVSVIPGKFGSIGTEKRKTKPALYESICRYL
jgi:hypothetical protein